MIKKIENLKEALARFESEIQYEIQELNTVSQNYLREERFGDAIKVIEKIQDLSSFWGGVVKGFQGFGYPLDGSENVTSEASLPKEDSQVEQEPKIPNPNPNLIRYILEILSDSEVPLKRKSIVEKLIPTLKDRGELVEADLSPTGSRGETPLARSVSKVLRQLWRRYYAEEEGVKGNWVIMERGLEQLTQPQIDMSRRREAREDTGPKNPVIPGKKYCFPALKILNLFGTLSIGELRKKIQDDMGSQFSSTDYQCDASGGVRWEVTFSRVLSDLKDEELVTNSSPYWSITEKGTEKIRNCFGQSQLI